MNTMSALMAPAIETAERGQLPDPIIRWGIRRLCHGLRKQSLDSSATDRLVTQMHESAVALVPNLANEQHYEVPPAFFQKVLGRRMKYSSCHWSEGTATLDAAEIEALQRTCEHAELENGQRILELGCGWGSLTLWMAERYPSSRITAVTNSSLQAPFLRNLACERGLSNVEIVQSDMNDFDPTGQFDRVVSIEMFEHMRNWGELLRRINEWLSTEGKLFIHVFRHTTKPYLYRDTEDDWMGRHFFSGGIMPSRDLLSRFDADLEVRELWDWDGTHYEKTANAWLDRLDESRDEIQEIFEASLPVANARRQLHRWRLFFLACAELFGAEAGNEWGVSHYLLSPSGRRS